MGAGTVRRFCGQSRPLGGSLARHSVPTGCRLDRDAICRPCQRVRARRRPYLRLGFPSARRLPARLYQPECLCRSLSSNWSLGAPITATVVRKLPSGARLNALASGCTKLTLAMGQHLHGGSSRRADGRPDHAHHRRVVGLVSRPGFGLNRTPASPPRANLTSHKTGDGDSLL